jgi:hypothetical protein
VGHPHRVTGQAKVKNGGGCRIRQTQPDTIPPEHLQRSGSRPQAAIDRIPVVVSSLNGAFPEWWRWGSSARQ